MPGFKPIRNFGWVALTPFMMAVAMPSHAQEFLIFEGKEVIREGEGGSKRLSTVWTFGWMERPPNPLY